MLYKQNFIADCLGLDDQELNIFFLIKVLVVTILLKQAHNIELTFVLFVRK